MRPVEEKFNKKEAARKNGEYGDKYDEDSDSSNDEDEDDDGFLATMDLDAEISATLQAIKNKDPAVYDAKVTFYKPIEEGEGGLKRAEKEKTMTLKDYHRENLLRGGIEEEEERVPQTFAQEQEALKASVLKEMRDVADAAVDESDDESDAGFMKKKETSKAKPAADGVHPSRSTRVKVEVDPTEADKDPETFLSNFMAARAWVPGEGAGFAPLESDDDEDDERAEKYEEAYNLRFENPENSNEVLKSFARDIIASRSVRREEPKGRKKQREAEREKKEAAKQEREEDRMRLRKLKIEEMEQRLAKIKKAAGIKGASLKDDEWTTFLDENWDDKNWEEEMNKKFGEDYYAEQDMASESDDEATSLTSRKRKVKKPKWDDDIDIKDIIPDFVEEDEEEPAFSLTDDEAADDGELDDDLHTNDLSAPKKKTSKDHKADRTASKKAARLERAKIESLVDAHLSTDLPTNTTSTFRYRETSPSAYGLTARDILLADDTALNNWAGLKKLASFRDVEKKRKDKKRLSKKARLREWRKETFGDEEGPVVNVGEGFKEGVGEDVGGEKKKRKRNKAKAKA